MPRWLPPFLLIVLALLLTLPVLALVAALTMWRMLPGDIVGDRRTLRERLSVVSVPGMKRSICSK